MKNLKVFALFLLSLTVAFAQQVDKKSDQILKGVSTQYKTYKSLKANFTIVIENSQEKSKDVQKGTLYLKGNKYKLDFAGQDVISDGKTRWTFVKDANEVQIDNQRTDESSISPTNIFTIYEKGWTSKFIAEDKDAAGNAVDMIELIPTNPKNKNVFKVKLSISKKDKMISSAKIFQKNGSTQTISVDKLTPEGASDEALYVFNSAKYPGSEIVDLR